MALRGELVLKLHGFIILTLQLAGYRDFCKPSDSLQQSNSNFPLSWIKPSSWWHTFE